MSLVTRWQRHDTESVTFTYWECNFILCHPFTTITRDSIAYYKIVKEKLYINFIMHGEAGRLIERIFEIHEYKVNWLL